VQGTGEKKSRSPTPIFARPPLADNHVSLKSRHPSQPNVKEFSPATQRLLIKLAFDLFSGPFRSIPIQTYMDCRRPRALDFHQGNNIIHPLYRWSPIPLLGHGSFLFQALTPSF